MKTDEQVSIARALVTAMPYVQRWAGQRVVIKVGGSSMTSDGLIEAVAQDLVLLRAVGIEVVLVHGGGPAVSEMGRRLGIEPNFVDGLRVTGEDMMRVAQLVQVGGVSRDLLAAIARFGGSGVGLSGHDGGGWLRGTRRKHVSRETGQPVDLGRVGDIESVDIRLITAATGAGVIPVIAPVAVDSEFKALNVNADSVATAVAAALGAPRLLFLSDVDGVKGPSGLVSRITASDARSWIADGTISGGMVPKVEACLSALDAGVQRVSIVDGRQEHASLVELLTKRGVGTLVTAG
jgi:acetylglutamate kinase